MSLAVACHGARLAELGPLHDCAAFPNQLGQFTQRGNPQRRATR
jgi:hypothetical protein